MFCCGNITACFTSLLRFSALTACLHDRTVRAFAAGWA